jgi:hypothetical protein
MGIIFVRFHSMPLRVPSVCFSVINESEAIAIHSLVKTAEMTVMDMASYDINPY